MGDFAHADLTREDGLYPHLRGATCWGCAGAFEADDGCYATHEQIWHSGCWPHENYELAALRDGQRTT